MKKSLFTIGIFALVMSMSCLFAGATQVTTKQVKSSILPEVVVKTFIYSIHSESSIAVSIEGRVKDQYSDPVANASIAINNVLTEYSTDLDGNYHVNSIQTGSVITFICDGYATTSFKVNKSGQQDDVIMELLSYSNLAPMAISSESNIAVSIEGRVKDQYSDPVANASIAINNVLTEYSTDLDGNYHINSIQTGSVITFICDGYATTSFKVNKSGQQDDVIMELLSYSNLAPNAISSESNIAVSIEGRVKDQYSDPVANASIAINNVLTEYSTDLDGNYHINSIQTGSVITFICDGYATASFKINKSGQQDDVIMELLSY